MCKKNVIRMWVQKSHADQWYDLIVEFDGGRTEVIGTGSATKSDVVAVMEGLANSILECNGVLMHPEAPEDAWW
jgi:hypothetical protein